MTVAAHSGAATATVPVVGSYKDAVTPRQLELLSLYASGYSYSEIGEAKFLSPYTVRNNLALALRRTGAKTLTQLCVGLLESGMIRRSHATDIYEPVADLRIVGE